jgi:hypothetical protein
MKTSIAKFFLPIGVLLIATARPTSANLIVNGDFETGTFAGWTTTPAATGSDFGVGVLPLAHDTLAHSLVRMVPILTRSAKPLSLRRALPTI